MRLSVLAASLVFAAISLGFLINTPTLLGPDEVYQFDRVVAAAHGDILPTPGALYVSAGVRGIERTFVVTQEKRNAPSWAQFVPSQRQDRKTLDQLGGNRRPVTGNVTNYMTQHPPLYFAVMGAVMWLIPDAGGLHGDTLVLLLRFFSLLLLLPLPYLFGRAALALFGAGPVSRAAPFLPLLVPGLARGAATLNNDNLAILIGAAVVVFSVQVMRGDRTARTALILALLCIAGSLTKGTELILLAIVPIAYVVQAFRLRGLPGRNVLVVLSAGAVLSAVWWVVNLVRYGHLVPEELAWGSQYPLATGQPRTTQPFDAGLFWSTMRRSVPNRFWGALGLHEPPQLPWSMIWILWAGLFVALAIALVRYRGRRLDLLVLWVVPAISLAAVVYTSYAHYQHYMAISGIQGRYTYPAVFGMLLPFASAFAVLLGRAARWTPAVVCALGVLVSGWAVYTSVEYSWLPRGSQLAPGNWYRAFRYLAGFFPLPGVVAGLAVLLALALLVAGAFLTVRSVLAVRMPPARSEPGSADRTPLPV